MSSEKLSVLDRTRVDVAREVISARPCSRRCHPRSDRYSTVSVPMSSEKQSALDRVRADVAREAIGARPYPRRCRPRGDRCSTVSAPMSSEGRSVLERTVPMSSEKQSVLDRIHADVLDRINVDVVREVFGTRPHPHRCRSRNDQSTVSASMSSEKRSVLHRIPVDVAREAINTRPYPRGARSRSRCSGFLKSVVIFAGPTWPVHLQNNEISTVMGTHIWGHF